MELTYYHILDPLRHLTLAYILIFLNYMNKIDILM